MLKIEINQEEQCGLATIAHTLDGETWVCAENCDVDEIRAEIKNLYTYGERSFDDTNYVPYAPAKKLKAVESAHTAIEEEMERRTIALINAVSSLKPGDKFFEENKEVVETLKWEAVNLKKKRP